MLREPGLSRRLALDRPLATSHPARDVAAPSRRRGSALAVFAMSCAVDDRRAGLPNTRSPTTLRHARTADRPDETAHCRPQLCLPTLPKASITALMLSSATKDAHAGWPKTGPKAAVRRNQVTRPMVCTLRRFPCAAPYNPTSWYLAILLYLPEGACTCRSMLSGATDCMSLTCWVVDTAALNLFTCLRTSSCVCVCERGPTLMACALRARDGG